MLTSLEISNFGLVKKLALKLKPGLTVLTGETGAGKSVVIEALQVALGGRAYTEYIKTGEEKALVQAVFELGALPELNSWLAEIGLESEDGILILTRQLSRSGRNICRVNGQVVTLQQLRQVGSYLLDMHGQHEQHSLLNPAGHVSLLDKFGGEKLLAVKQRVAEIYKQWQSTWHELEEIKSSQRERARKADMLRYQLQEIDSAGLKINEDEVLETEKNRLVNAEKIVSLAQQAYDALYRGEDGRPPAVDRLGEAAASLDKLREVDASVAPFLEAVNSALYQVEEVARDIISYRDKVEFNPARLDEIENRLREISRLKTKYGDSVQEILDFRQKAETELKLLESMGEKTSNLESRCAELEAAYYTAAGELSQLRTIAAQKLKQALEKELQDLEMRGVTLEVALSPVQPGSAGKEKIEFLISTNAGEPPKPLVKIASGGELSRIMLAFKSVLAGMDDIPTLVFDEVDAGIGGKTLQAVANKLAELACRRQTIVVTHAAPIAAKADTHYYVYKQYNGDNTVTRIAELEGDSRVRELARMLGGREKSKPVLEHARQLLEMK